MKRDSQRFGHCGLVYRNAISHLVALPLLGYEALPEGPMGIADP
jgi:hypothetical protein